MTILPVFVSFSLLLANLGWPVTHHAVLDATSQASAKADKLFAAGNYQEAVEAYTEAVRLDPHNSKAYLGLAQAHGALNQPERVEEDYELAIRAAPEADAPRAARAVARIFAQRYADAIPDLDAAIRLEPDDASLYHWRGLARLNLEQPELALPDFNRALQADPQGNDSFGDDHNNRGLAEFALGRYEEALADYNRATEAGDDNVNARADCLTKLKRYPEALALYNGLLPPLEADAAPGDERAGLLCQRAFARIGVKDIKGADADLAEAVGLKPDDPVLYGNVAWAYLLANQPAEGRIAALQGLILDGSLEWVRINLADAYLLEGRFEQAKNIYLKEVDQWMSPGKTGLQAVRQDLADLRDAGIDSPAIASMEALLPKTSSPPPPPAPTAIKITVNSPPPAGGPSPSPAP